MILSLIINNWRKFLFGGISIILLGYCIIVKYEMNSLKTKASSQQNIINSQKLAYQVLTNEMQIREAAIEKLNIALNEKRAKHENDQRTIIQNKTRLDDGDNRISMLWLRLAVGDMSAIPATSSTIIDKTQSTRYIIASSGAAGINQYIESCEIVVTQLNTLIDEFSASSKNYNNLATKYSDTTEVQ